MAQEEPECFVALSLEVDGREFKCSGQRVFSEGEPLRVSWYTEQAQNSSGYIPIMNGVVFILKRSISHIANIDQFSPTYVGDTYRWRDHASHSGLMITLTLPQEFTLARWKPQLIEAKVLRDRLAVFWLLYPSSQEDDTVTIEWSPACIEQPLPEDVERINRVISLAQKRPVKTDYDVALSFAGEDRQYVGEVARTLDASGVRVFYDEIEQVKLWGANLYDTLTDVYYKRARFTIMFISRHYAKKRWTNLERKAAQARAFTESREYILPVRFDDTEIPTNLPTIGYLHARDFSPADLAEFVIRKLEAGTG